ncbi:hypothetical protein VF21_05057 [Pseudogymnoascus sp. 05NY08]|nr:hypothetical protein VF21_05057 [Pseudogymnoascus sp. 05NY08]
MSWQEYVDKSLLGSGNLDKGAIITAGGDAIWAITPGFDIQGDETKKIAAALAGGEAEDKMRADGIYIAGERFTFVQSRERHIYGRKDKEGIVIVKTKQAVVIGHYGEKVQPAHAASTVEQLADFIIQSGY